MNDSDEVRKAKLLRTRKIQILEADQHLGKSYRDLVETSKVIDDDEFWATHMPDFAASCMWTKTMQGIRKKVD